MWDRIARHANVPTVTASYGAALISSDFDCRMLFRGGPETFHVLAQQPQLPVDLLTVSSLSQSVRLTNSTAASMPTLTSRCPTAPYDAPALQLGSPPQIYLPWGKETCAIRFLHPLSPANLSTAARVCGAMRNRSAWS